MADSRGDIEPLPADTDVDWESLRAAATHVMRMAYAPYSNFPVGVAGLVDNGRIVVGCNVENAAYGVGLCAECGLVSALHATGGGRLLAVVCVDGDEAVLMPCGRCRQLLWESGGPAMQIATADGVKTMSEILPDAFGPVTLTVYRSTSERADESVHESAHSSADER